MRESTNNHNKNKRMGGDRRTFIKGVVKSGPWQVGGGEIGIYTLIQDKILDRKDYMKEAKEKITLILPA